MSLHNDRVKKQLFILRKTMIDFHFFLLQFKKNAKTNWSLRIQRFWTFTFFNIFKILNYIFRYLLYQISSKEKSLKLVSFLFFPNIFVIEKRNPKPAKYRCKTFAFPGKRVICSLNQEYRISKALTKGLANLKDLANSKESNIYVAKLGTSLYFF